MRGGEVVDGPARRARRLGGLLALVIGLPVVCGVLPICLFVLTRALTPIPEITFFVSDPEPMGCWVAQDGSAAVVTLTLDIEDPDEVEWGMPYFDAIRSGTLDGAAIGSGRLFPPGVGLGSGQTPPSDAELKALLDAPREGFGHGPSGSTLAFVVERSAEQPEYGFGSIVLPFTTGGPAYTQTMPVDVRVRDGECSIRMNQPPS